MFSAITRSIFGYPVLAPPKPSQENLSAIIYCRISSEQQSLDAQEFSCKKFCEDRGINIFQIVRETGSARSALKNLKNLNSIIRGNRNTTIVVYSVDRFCRNTSDSMVLIRNMEKNNINLMSVTDSIDLSTASGKHAFRMRVSAAELESDLISERVKRSVAFRKARGDSFGVSKFGYRTVILGSGKRIKQVNPSEQSVIRFIRKNCYADVSSEAFTRDLYTLLEIYEKPEDFFVPVVFENSDESDSSNDEAIDINGNIIVLRAVVTTEMISDVLNDYEILNRNKQWTSCSIGRVYKQQNVINHLRDMTI